MEKEQKEEEENDHLAQFISVEKDTGDKAQPNCYKRWKDQNEIYDDYIWRFKSCVNRHAPRKKVNKREQKLINKPGLKKIKHRNDIFVKKKDKT